MNAEIDLLGGFAVRIDDRPIPPTEWRRRQAASLVKLLALAPRRTLHREQVIDALWPGAGNDDAGPRLHKAAHFAKRKTATRRRAAGRRLRHRPYAARPRCSPVT
jgi:DNA-binding SARP family transcriptional activator